MLTVQRPCAQQTGRHCQDRFIRNPGESYRDDANDGDRPAPDGHRIGAAPSERRGSGGAQSVADPVVAGQWHGHRGSGRAHRVETVGDLDRALAVAPPRDGQFVLLDVRLDKLDVSPALRRLGASLQEAATQGPETVDG